LGTASYTRFLTLPGNGAKLYLPDEVRRMPPEEQLLFVKGNDPVRARKLRYFEDEEFAGLYYLNPLHRINVLINGS
jgi:type IV secretion system protein VirD4